jgi:flagellar protein FlgJ
MWTSAGIAERLAVDTQGLQALKSRAAANDPEALRMAARQFEALLLQTLLRQMRETSWRAAEDPFAPSESLKLYRELLDRQWVQRIVQGRGLGFAEKMAEQMLKGQGLGEAAITPPPQAVGRFDTRPGTGPVSAVAEADGTGRPPKTPTGPAVAETLAMDVDTRKARFLQSMRPHAEAAARTTGVPADFILAHAALESGWGAREIRAVDGRPSHNLFGIKAGSAWSGLVVEAQTTEYRQGLPVRLTERFRAYADYAEAFADYANLLSKRYGNALRAGADADAFAQALAAGGYATDPAYAGKLRGVIKSVNVASATFEAPHPIGGRGWG